jgi:hypothetical protein
MISSLTPGVADCNSDNFVVFLSSIQPGHKPNRSGWHDGEWGDGFLRKNQDVKWIRLPPGFEE